MITKLDLAKEWLPRYTGMQVDDFGDYILLTNFSNYVQKFANMFGTDICGLDRPMQATTNSKGLSMVNFGIGSPNAATIMDLLTARRPKGVLFLGKCGGVKKSTEIGYFILPIAAIRGEGTSGDYLPAQVPGCRPSSCISLFRRSLSLKDSTIEPVSYSPRIGGFGSMTMCFVSS